MERPLPASEETPAQPAMRVRGSDAVVRKLPSGGLLLALVTSDIVLLSGLAVGVISLSPMITADRVPLHIEGVVLALLAFVVFATLSGLYRTPGAFDLRRAVPRVINTLIFIAFVFFTALYVFQFPLLFSRAAFLALFFGGIFLLILVRVLMSAVIAYMLAAGYAFERVFVVSFRADAARFVSTMRIGSGNRMRLAGLVQHDEPDVAATLRTHLSRLDIDAVVFLAQHGDNMEENTLFVMAQHSPLAVYVALPHSDFPGEILRALDQGSYLLLQTSRQPIEGWGAIQKRALDIVLATAGLVVTSPILLLAAIAIKVESRGPVLFRQTRFGYNNRAFTILKLRSMHCTDDDDGVVRQTRTNDARVTRVGRIIRKLRIDELPQLINVLRGDMSIVGPRAHATRTDLDGLSLEAHEARYLTRHNVRPGLTSWAIVNGCTGAMDSPEKLRETVEYDLHYIRHWSIWLDLTIIAMTFVFVVAENRALGRRKVTPSGE